MAKRKKTDDRRGDKGRGSVFQSPKESGRWFARLPPEYPGGPVGQRFRVESEEIGRKLLDEKLAQQRRGIQVHRRWRLGDWLDHWLEEHVRVELEPTTYDSYESVVRLHIKPRLGSLWLDEVETSHIVQWRNDLKRANVSEAKIKDARSRLHRAFEEAILQRIGGIERNPVTATKAPKPKRRKGVALNREQALALLTAAESYRLAALYFLAITTGMRQAELLGLRWNDVSLDGKPPTLNIQKQLKSVLVHNAEPGKPKRALTFKNVKNNRARVIALDAVAVSVLKAHWEKQQIERRKLGVAWREHGMVFASEKGTPIYASNLTDRWQKIRAAIGFPDLHFHDLRHTAGSLMLSGGLTIADVSVTLGHADVDITAKIYLHGDAITSRRAVASVTTQLQPEGIEAKHAQ